MSGHEVLSHQMMNEIDETPSWLVYERCVAAYTVGTHGGFNTIVQPNVTIKGAVSGEPRQVDVLIASRWEQSANTRIIVDAKEWTCPIDIGDVEKFEGMMRDCRADRGIIVCTKGYTKGALRRAQDAITIKILPLDDLEEFSWMYESCLGHCTKLNRKSKRRGGVLWTEYLSIVGITGMMLIIQTGKCDGCHAFHVWCWDCGEKFPVPDKEIVACDCDRSWAAVPESTGTGHEGEPESVWLMMREDDDPAHLPVVLDRRPFR